MTIYVLSEEVEAFSPAFLFSFWALTRVAANVHVPSMHLSSLSSLKAFLDVLVFITVALHSWF